MGRLSSKLRIRRITGTSRWQSARTILAGCAAIFLGCPGTALAALPCGAQPPILPVDSAEQIKRDAQSTANLIRHAPSDAKLRKFVAASRAEFRQKHADGDAVSLDHYLLWVTCQTISNDPTKVPTQKFDEYSNVYRLMSEPIAEAAEH